MAGTLDLSKIVAYAVLGPPALEFSLAATISPVVSTAILDNIVDLSLIETISPITSSGVFGPLLPRDFALNKTIDPITSDSSYYILIDLTLDSTLSITPYIHVVVTPFTTASLDPFHDPVWVAVEFDLFDENDLPITLRLCNRGVVTRTVSGTQYQYLPRLSSIPVELGTTITVTSYGSPVRGQPNGGIIKFALDEAIWGWFFYRWNGQVFRVYYGKSVDPVTTDVDLDLTLIYAGRIASIKHDTLEVSIGTTDETLQWDNPLVEDLYDDTYIEALRQKPKPQLWGYGFGIEPILEVEATQTYAVSYRVGGLDFISQVRVGGIPWNLNLTGPPTQGEWTPDLANGKFKLGSPTLGMDVRCDAQQGSFTVAGLITRMIEDVGGTVDAISMAALDSAMPGKIGYATSTTPVNLLDAIDDFVTNVGCWWSVGPLGAVVGGVIDVPSLNASLLLDNKVIKSLQLNTVHPPAWKIKVGFQRNWSPESTFATSVLQAEQKKWSEDGQVYSPHYENNAILALEPRAVDVPALNGSFVSQADARPVQQRLVTAWGTVRSLFDVDVYMLPEDIVLYDTVALNYMMVTGNFRITSAIKAIGTGPAKLQLWGTIGPYAVEPPPSPLPIVSIDDMGIWTRSSGSGNFVVGVDAPSTTTHLWVRGVGGGGGGAGNAVDGSTFIAGGGGGAGGYFEDVLTVSSGSSIAWSVGSFGSGGIAGALGAAADGLDTTFGSASGFGGGGGTVSTTSFSGGIGGGASGATVGFTGGPGGNGYTRDVDDIDDDYTSFGGASAFGGGGQAGNGGGSPGGGGGGRVGGTGLEGGFDGKDGLIIVVWFS